MSVPVCSAFNFAFSAVNCSSAEGSIGLPSSFSLLLLKSSIIFDAYMVLKRSSAVNSDWTISGALYDTYGFSYK